MFANSRLGNICYYVSDIDRTEAFYRDVLGLSIDRMDDDETGPFLIGHTANGIDLLFFQMESRPGNSPIIVFDLDQGGIDDVVAALAEKGATIVTPVSHAPGGWSADVADPDGHAISMFQNGDVPRSRK